MTDHIDVPIVATGDWIDAAWINQYIGDNVRAWRQAYTQKGAMAYALDSNTLAELAPPASLSILKHAGGSSNVPQWSTFMTAVTGAIVATSGSMAILTGTSTYASFGSELVDQDNYFSLSNPTYLTIPADGWYVVSAYAVYGAITAGGYRYTYIEVNTPSTIIAEDIRSSSPSGVVTEVNLSGVHYFTAGDVVKLRAYQSSGSTLTLDARMAIVKVG